MSRRKKLEYVKTRYDKTETEFIQENRVYECIDFSNCPHKSECTKVQGHRWNMSFKRFLLRGLDKVNLEGGLLCFALNIKRMNNVEKVRKCSIIESELFKKERENMITTYSNQKESIKEQEIKQAAEEIKKGNLVLFPTETVYGIGANALDEKAVKKIFEAKGRASDNPLIVHVSSLAMVEDIVEKIGDLEKKLIETFWPGPLTIIFKRKSRQIIPNIVTANLDTVGIRMPSNQIARKLIEYANVPIAAPSANISGKPSGTKIEDIIDELDGKVSYILDGGQTQVGLESTVIRVEEDSILILRPGKITKEQLEKVAKEVKIDKHVLQEVNSNETVTSPGMKYRHYAPNTKCMMVCGNESKKVIEKINELINQTKQDKKKVLVLARKEHLPYLETDKKWNMGDNLEEIAKNIFTLLRKVDKEQVDLVIIEGVEKQGLGLAIYNRLIRACAYQCITLEDEKKK